MIILTEDKKEDYIYELSKDLYSDGLTLDDLYNIVFFGYEADKDGNTNIFKRRVNKNIVLLLCLLTNIDYQENGIYYTFNVVGYEKK